MADNRSQLDKVSDARCSDGFGALANLKLARDACQVLGINTPSGISVSLKK
jgi:hypothetical protein